jgi:hypothetical protein
MSFRRSRQWVQPAPQKLDFVPEFATVISYLISVPRDYGQSSIPAQLSS